MADDDNWLSRMGPREREVFTSGTRRFFELHARLKATGEAAALERAVVDAADPVEVRAYWQALSGHFRRMARANDELADITAEMAAVLDGHAG
jgi:hypothetical protein